MHWLSQRKTNGQYHAFAATSSSRDWHGGPFPTYGELAQRLSLAMRPTRTASPLCFFSPQWPETWLSPAGSCANILVRFEVCLWYIPGFLKTGVAKISTHSTAWQFKTINSFKGRLKAVIWRRTVSYINVGFAKSRSAAHGPRRPSGQVAPSWFSTVFSSSGKSMRMHRSASGLDDGEFEFVYHFNHLNPCFCLLHVVQIRTFSFSVHSSLYRNR